MIYPGSDVVPSTASIPIDGPALARPAERLALQRPSSVMFTKVHSVQVTALHAELSHGDPQCPTSVPVHLDSTRPVLWLMITSIGTDAKDWPSQPDAVMGTVSPDVAS